jgi:1-acyl-sn-glycerol-3-phosphate acyltransferase
MPTTMTTTTDVAPAPGARLLWVPLNVLQAIAVAVVTTVLTSIAMLVRLVSARGPLMMARWLWAPAMLAIGGVRLEVSGREHLNDEGVRVFVANHESMVDIPVVFRILPAPLRFILKRELAFVPFLGQFAWATGMVFVDRRRRERAIAALRRVRALRGGGSIIAFPEGTRSRGRGILPFKKGVFISAIDAQIPIVPIAIVGAERVLPCSGFRVRPGTIRVAIGEPIATTGLTLADRGQLAVRAREAVVALHESISR